MVGPIPLLTITIAPSVHPAQVAFALVVDKSHATQHDGLTVARGGAGGGTRTPTGIAALRIFIPATAFAALAPHTDAEGASLWSGLSLHRAPAEPEFRCCPSSLYTFPWRARALRGLARDCQRRFPRVWAVLHPGFPPEHSGRSPSPLRLPVSPRPRDPLCISLGAVGGLPHFPGSQHLTSKRHAASARIRG